MAYKVVLNLDLKDNYDIERGKGNPGDEWWPPGCGLSNGDSDHLKAINIFNNYKNNGRIINYSNSILDSLNRQEIFSFDSKNSWDSYLSELDECKPLSYYEITVVSKTEE